MCCSNGAVKGVGVTAEPEIRDRELTPQDQFIVLASDGVSAGVISL